MHDDHTPTPPPTPAMPEQPAATLPPPTSPTDTPVGRPAHRSRRVAAGAALVAGVAITAGLAVAARDDTASTAVEPASSDDAALPALDADDQIGDMTGDTTGAPPAMDDRLGGHGPHGQFDRQPPEMGAVAQAGPSDDVAAATPGRLTQHGADVTSQGS